MEKGTNCALCWSLYFSPCLVVGSVEPFCAQFPIVETISSKLRSGEIRILKGEIRNLFRSVGHFLADLAPLRAYFAHDKLRVVAKVPQAQVFCSMDNFCVLRT